MKYILKRKKIIYGHHESYQNNLVKFVTILSKQTNKKTEIERNFLNLLYAYLLNAQIKYVNSKIIKVLS